MKLPSSRGALLEHRLDLKEMLQAVKEIEAMNRTDVSSMVVKVDELRQVVLGYDAIKKKNGDVSIQ